MADQPKRVIEGLARRVPTADLSRMRAANRAQPAPEQPSAPPAAAAAPTAPTEAPERPEAALAAAQQPAAKKVATRPSKRSSLSDLPATGETPRGPVSATSEGGKDRITTYVSTSTRARAQAAFRATQHIEGDESWSNFVEKAIIQEAERRESAHNGGQPFQSAGGRLPAGRPLRG